jgi:hypothetical protein
MPSSHAWALVFNICVNLILLTCKLKKKLINKSVSLEDKTSGKIILILFNSENIVLTITKFLPFVQPECQQRGKESQSGLSVDQDLNLQCPEYKQEYYCKTIMFST